MKTKLPLVLLIITIFTTSSAQASIAGDYRSVASGDWSSAATWQRFTGLVWVSATKAPSSTDGVITISTGDSVTIGATRSTQGDSTFADQVVVNAGAILDVETPFFILMNGKGTDMVVSGKLIVGVGDNISNISNQLTDRSTINYFGDSLMCQGGISSDISFNGPQPQSIFGNCYLNGFVTLNNAHNVTVKNTVSVGQTTFLNGKLIAEGFLVITQYTGAFIGAGSTRFIDGKVIYIAYDNTQLSVTIPLGTGNRYLPVVFTSQKNQLVETHYTFTLVNAAPPVFTLPAIFDKLLGPGYLNIVSDHPGNLVKATVELSYDPVYQVANTSRLRIVKTNSQVIKGWVNEGGSGSTRPSGTISTSFNFNTLGDFALANIAASSLVLDSSISSGNTNSADIYKLTTNADGLVRLVLTSNNNNALTTELLDNDKLTVLGTLNVPANTTRKLSTDGLAKGAYFVKVLGADTTMPYEYTLMDSLLLPALANNTEPDSTKALARTLLLNSDTTGHIGYYYNNHRDTVDWYKITTNSDGLLKVTLTSGNSNPITLSLFDNNGLTNLGKLNVKGNSSAILSRDGLAKGTYYVTVSSINNTRFATYIIANNLLVPAQANNLEPDSTKALAHGLLLNNNTTGHVGYYYNNHRDTADWYKITTNVAGTLKLSITSANANAVSLTLYNSSGTTSLGSIHAGGNSTGSLSKNGLAAGTYYVVISSVLSSSFEPYILTDSIISGGIADYAPAIAGMEQIEVNKTLARVQLYPNPVSNEFRLHISGVPPNNGTVALALKNMNGETVWSIAKTNISSLQGLAVGVSKLPSGIYFLQITSENKNIFVKKIIVSR